MGNIEKFRMALLGNIAKQVKPQQPVFKVKPNRPLTHIWKETVPDQRIGGYFKKLLSEEALWVTIDEETFTLRPVLFGEMSLQLIDYFNFFQRAKEAVRQGTVTTPVYLRGEAHATSVYRNMQITPLQTSFNYTHWWNASCGFGDWKEQHFRRRVFNAINRERQWLTGPVLVALDDAIRHLDAANIDAPGLIAYLCDISAIYHYAQASCDNALWLLTTRESLNLSAAMLRDVVSRHTVLEVCNYSVRSDYSIDTLIDIENIELLYRQASPVFSLPHGHK